MSDKEVPTPRLVYKGAADDTAETKSVADQAELAAALKDGFRLTRVDAKHQPPAPDATDGVKVPAQTLKTEKK